MFCHVLPKCKFVEEGFLTLCTAELVLAQMRSLVSLKAMRKIKPLSTYIALEIGSTYASSFSDPSYLGRISVFEGSVLLSVTGLSISNQRGLVDK